jgi:hypothetical protein
MTNWALSRIREIIHHFPFNCPRLGHSAAYPQADGADRLPHPFTYAQPHKIGATEGDRDETALHQSERGSVATAPSLAGRKSL